MAVVNVGDKLFVGTLVSGSFGEMEPHKGDKDVNVSDRHGLHVTKLGGRCVDGGNVLGRSRRGVVLESESRLRTTCEKLALDGGACHGVAKEDLRPGASGTVRRVDAIFGKDFVKRAKQPGLSSRDQSFFLFPVK
jgi:hypothetical protein